MAKRSQLQTYGKAALREHHGLKANEVLWRDGSVGVGGEYKRLTARASRSGNSSSAGHPCKRPPASGGPDCAVLQRAGGGGEGVSGMLTYADIC